VAYTLSKQDTDFAFTDAYVRTQDVGPASSDRRHQLVMSSGIQLPADVVAGVIFSYRTTTPFTPSAGIDLNNDGSTNDAVPGTHRGMGNRENTAMVAAVNAYRASRGLAPISESQLDTNALKRVDLRLTKGFSLGSSRKVELVGQVFNLFGANNLGGIGSNQIGSAIAPNFGQIPSAQPRQQGEVAIRYIW
jgi:hypothetical protein